MIVTTHQAKTNLSKLIQRALDGEEIIIARRNQPLVKLTAISEKKPQRRFGALKHLVLTMGDDFDDELEDFAEYAPKDLPKVAEDPKPYNT